MVAAGRLSRRRPFLPLGRADRAAVHAAIDAVGLTDKAHDGVATLSGGQQQRALIARALAGEPDLLVLDEPTAGVDLESQQAFADAISGLVARGATVVLVAHELGPMADLVDRAVVMREGRVAYDGPPLASFAEPRTATTTPTSRGPPVRTPPASPPPRRPHHDPRGALR